MRCLAVSLTVVMAVSALAATAQERLPLFDAHVHYSHDSVEMIPPAAAVAILRQAGIRRALVSSSDDEGTQRLWREAPDLIVPSLRPYRRRSDTAGWTNDPTIIAYVEDRLSRYRYRALGEFHAFGSDIEKPVVQRMIALARHHKLMLHAHSDADAIDRIFKSYPEAIVLWAHSGFDRPERVREMLQKHPNLWADLAFRNDHASGGVVAADWKAVFEEFPDRFMVGTDTFTPERWHYIGPHADFSRRWLSSLPRDLAERIAYRNAEAMLLKVAPGPGLQQ